jgi:hypothetical protein
MGKLTGGSSLRSAMMKVMHKDYRKSGRPGPSSMYTGMKPGGAPANAPAGSTQQPRRTPADGRRSGGAMTPLGG